MIGKPTHCDTTNPHTQQDSYRINHRRSAETEADVDAGSIAEHVAESDLPNLLQMVYRALHDICDAGRISRDFVNLGGLRIWLPLLATSHANVRRMTLSLLRTYINLKSNMHDDDVHDEDDDAKAAIWRKTIIMTHRLSSSSSSSVKHKTLSAIEVHMIFMRFISAQIFLIWAVSMNSLRCSWGRHRHHT